MVERKFKAANLAAILVLIETPTSGGFGPRMTLVITYFLVAFEHPSVGYAKPHRATLEKRAIKEIQTACPRF